MNYDKSLQDIIFDMLCDRRYIFYGLFLAELNKGFHDTLPTACVGKHPNSANIMLFIGKHFWEKTLFNNSRKKAILIHELEHVIREHLSDMSQAMFPDHFIANVAMDVSINQTITEELPRLDENGQKCGVYIEDYPEMNLRKDESTLYYYQKFLKGKEDKQNSRGKKDSMAPGAGKGNKKGTSGSPGLDELLDAHDEGRTNIGRGRSGDWHDLWKELSDGLGDKEKELMRKEIQEMVRRVAEETQKLQGNIPGHISNSIKENFGIKPPVISWKTLFNRFVGSTLTTDIYQTRKRPNFRFEDAPSNKYKNKIRIVVGMDSSGSVSDYELQEFFGQVKHMYNAGVKIDIAIWDAAVHHEYEYKGENSYTRVCQGGTYASSFIEYVNKHKRKKNWTCAINLTDGYIESEPIVCNLPLLWVITSSGSTEFKHKAKKIKMN